MSDIKAGSRVKVEGIYNALCIEAEHLGTVLAIDPETNTAWVKREKPMTVLSWPETVNMRRLEVVDD